MPVFRFEAADREGRLSTGVFEAGSRDDAVDRLVSKGLIPVKVLALGVRGGALAERGDGTGAPVSAQTLAILRELATLLRAGLTVSQALGVIARLVPGRRAAMIGRVHAAVRAGRPLSEAMLEAPSLFPRAIRGAAAAGEASGRLPDMLEQLARWVERDLATRRKIAAMLTYPVILFFVMAGAMAVIFSVVLPRLEPLFRGADAQLPMATRIVLALGRFFREQGEGAGLVLVGAGVVFLALLRLPAVRAAVDAALLRPHALFGLPRRIAAARFSHTLSTLLLGGMSLDRALAATAAATGNGALRAALQGATGAVRRGERLGASIERTGLMPPSVVELASVGEETGRLGEMLAEAGRALDDDIGHRLDRVATILPPLITLVLGGLVAGLMAGVVGGLLAANEFAL